MSGTCQRDWSPNYVLNRSYNARRYLNIKNTLYGPVVGFIVDILDAR